MDLKENLTTEKIRQRFGNQFDLVSYAISLARNLIETGRQPRIKLESENPTLQVIAEISTGTDYFEEKPVKVEENKEESPISPAEEGNAPSKPEKKKNRKILIETT